MLQFSPSLLANATPREIPSTAYTLKADDVGLYLYTTNGSAVTVTVPLNTTVPFPVGTYITIEQHGAGKMTVAGETGGVTINPAATLSAGAQYGVVGLYQVTPNVWTLFGNIGA